MWSNRYVSTLFSFLLPAPNKRSQFPPFFKWGKWVWPSKNKTLGMKEGEKKEKTVFVHCPLFSLWWVGNQPQKDGKGLGGSQEVQCWEPGSHQVAAVGVQADAKVSWLPGFMAVRMCSQRCRTEATREFSLLSPLCLSLLPLGYPHYADPIAVPKGE